MPYKPFNNEETRSSVLSGVRSGSEAAWGRFFDLYAGYVFSLANQAGLIGTDADDIVQTVFAELSAPGGFDGYERGKGPFRPWLRRRVLWRIKDELRRRAARPHFAIFQASMIEDIPSEDVMALYHVTRDNLYQIRKRMREAFRRHFDAVLADIDAPLPPQ